MKGRAEREAAVHVPALPVVWVGECTGTWPGIEQERQTAKQPNGQTAKAKRCISPSRRTGCSGRSSCAGVCSADARHPLLSSTAQPATRPGRCRRLVLIRYADSPPARDGTSIECPPDTGGTGLPSCRFLFPSETLGIHEKSSIFVRGLHGGKPKPTGFARSGFPTGCGTADPVENPPPWKVSTAPAALDFRATSCSYAEGVGRLLRAQPHSVIRGPGYAARIPEKAEHPSLGTPKMENSNFGEIR